MAPFLSARRAGVSGGRVQSTDVLAAIRRGLSARYNPQGKSPDPTADYILKYSDYGTMKDG